MKLVSYNIQYGFGKDGRKFFNLRGFNSNHPGDLLTPISRQRRRAIGRRARKRERRIVILCKRLMTLPCVQWIPPLRELILNSAMPRCSFLI